MPISQTYIRIIAVPATTFASVALSRAVKFSNLARGRVASNLDEITNPKLVMSAISQ